MSTYTTVEHNKDARQLLKVFLNIYTSGATVFACLTDAISSPLWITLALAHCMPAHSLRQRLPFQGTLNHFPRCDGPTPTAGQYRIAGTILSASGTLSVPVHVRFGVGTSTPVLS